MTNIDNIEDALQGDTVDAILQKMGGIRPMAQKLNISVSTVQGWKQRRMIPKNRIKSIDTYFQHHFSMSVYDIITNTAPQKPPVGASEHLQTDTPPPSAVPPPKTPLQGLKTATPKTAPSVTKSAVNKQRNSHQTIKIIVSMCGISVITAVALILSTPYWYPVVMGNMQYQKIVQQVVPLTYADMTPFLHPLQTDIADLNNSLNKYTTTVQSDIQGIQTHVQDMQIASQNMTDLYTQIQILTENIQADIAHIQNSADIHTLYAIQWRILYGVIMGGESYAPFLSTVTIPKTDDTLSAWQDIATHKNGVITHRQIRQAIDKNAFLIAPALANTQITAESTLWQRIKAKLTHLVFVVDTPDGQDTSDNTALKHLYTALNSNDMAYIVQVLKPLQIHQLESVINRIEQRATVVQALQTIWHSLPQSKNTSTDKGTAQ